MRNKITVVGAGNVGATTAQRIFDKGHSDVVLVDIVERPISDMTLSVWMNGQFLMNVTSDSEGVVSILYPVPSDMPLVA